LFLVRFLLLPFAAIFIFLSCEGLSDTIGETIRPLSFGSFYSNAILATAMISILLNISRNNFSKKIPHKNFDRRKSIKILYIDTTPRVAFFTIHACALLLYILAIILSFIELESRSSEISIEAKYSISMMNRVEIVSDSAHSVISVLIFASSAMFIISFIFLTIMILLVSREKEGTRRI
jgi:hypothetical protein